MKQVLFAICHDAAPLAEVEVVAGDVIRLETSAAGGVTWERGSDADLAPKEGEQAKPKRVLKVVRLLGQCGFQFLSDFMETGVSKKLQCRQPGFAREICKA